MIHYKLALISVSIFRNSKWQSVNSGYLLDINTPVYFAEGEYTL